MKLIYKPIAPFTSYDIAAKAAIGKIYFIKKINGVNAIIGSAHRFENGDSVEVEDSKELVGCTALKNYKGEVFLKPLGFTKEVYKVKNLQATHGSTPYIMPDEDWMVEGKEKKSGVTGEEIEKQPEDYDVQTANIQHFIVWSAMGLLGGFFASKLLKINPAKSMVAGTVIGFAIGGLTKNK